MFPFQDQLSLLSLQMFIGLAPTGHPKVKLQIRELPNATTSRAITTIFGPVPEDLTKRLQTLSLLEARNQDLLNSLDSLNLQPNVIALIQKSCQDYQRNVITADELIRRLDSWIGYQTLHGKTWSKEQKKQGPPARMAVWQPVAVIRKEAEKERETDTKEELVCLKSSWNCKWMISREGN